MILVIRQYIVPAAYAVLPPAMNTPAATAMLVASALQESKARDRAQIGGPARSFWQFELTGVAGVRRHPGSQAHLKTALAALCYPITLSTARAHAAIEHNDVLACVFARLLLWTLPQELPAADEPDRGWDQYVDGWRPGKPHPETWAANFAKGWELA